MGTSRRAQLTYVQIKEIVPRSAKEVRSVGFPVHETSQSSCPGSAEAGTGPHPAACEQLILFSQTAEAI